MTEDILDKKCEQQTSSAIEIAEQTAVESSVGVAIAPIAQAAVVAPVAVVADDAKTKLKENIKEIAKENVKETVKNDRKSLFGGLNTDLQNALSSWDVITEQPVKKVSANTEQMMEVKKILVELKSKLSEFSS